LAAGLPTLASGQITNALNSLQAGGQNLAGLAMGGLSLGESGPLSAAMSAIGFGGAGAIKMPSIGLNTNNIAEVNAQIGSLLADSRIPKPNFGDVDESAAALLDAMLAQNDQIDSAFEEIDSLTVEVESAREEYFTLENNLPPGSPEVESAREAWIALSQDLEDRLESINGVINQAAANNEQSEQTFAGYTGPSVVYAADGTSSPVDSLGNAIRPLINGSFGTG
jgi:hypothetical protein